MDLESIISKIVNMDEKVRVINQEIFILKQDLKEYQKQQQEKQSNILFEINNLKELKQKQDKNNELIFKLIS